MGRVTVRLPEEVHEGLRAVSRRTGMSLNQTITAALKEAIARAGGDEGDQGTLREQLGCIRSTLGDVVTELDVTQLPPHLRPENRILDRDAFRRSLPELRPPLSTTILAEREEGD